MPTSFRGRNVVSAGLIAFRLRDGLEVLLAHPGGPYWRARDAGAWTIPKGEVDGNADPLAEARREFTEETGLASRGVFIPLSPVRQRSGKMVHAWAFEGDLDLTAFSSNLFEMEWPPRSGRRQSFPEVDRIAYFPYPEALARIIAYQKPLLLELRQIVGRAQEPPRHPKR
jgi:predicted NUDIX family NTP pyrophosphohydrolase